MFKKLGVLMRNNSNVNGWRDLKLGPMTDTVYPCYGAMEDWAYGASWDTGSNAMHKTWSPSSYLPFNKTEYFSNYSHIKPAIYLVEANNNKHPRQSRFGTKSNLDCFNWSADGHINRHIKLSLSFIDLMEPYPVSQALNLFSKIKFYE